MAKKIPATIKPKHYYMGMTILYLGESFKVTSTNKGNTKIDFQHKLIYVHEKNHTSELIKSQLMKVYRQHFIQLLSEEIAIYQPYYRVEINTVRIKKLKSRWGSCSSLGNLNFNLNLMMAPRPIIAYVVVHEMCHLMHMNHSKSFWDAVALKVPDWKRYRSWLRTYGHLLNFDYDIILGEQKC